ncbi:MAG: tetratricopeptide repeat protein [Proteobacteria bacterium]|nr:tetratricopeptide repeat protein [Pseudomonadota bacterium]
MAEGPVARNAACPCGSGRRYKHCHGRDGPPPPGADAEALFHEGNALRAAGRHDDAIERYERALQDAPAHAGLLNNLGLTLLDRNDPVAAEARFRRALASSPESFEALANLALALFAQHRFAAARVLFERALARRPVANASVWGNLAICQARAGARDAAALSFGQAIAVEPGSPELHCNLGALEIERKHFDRAARAFERALALDPGQPWPRSALLFCRQHVADWARFDVLREAEIVAARAESHSRTRQGIGPFGFLSICDDASLQRRVAEAWVHAREVRATPRRPLRRGRSGPLRLGFVALEVAAEHPVPRLIVELLERLDRTRFSVTFYTLGAAPGATPPDRLAAAVDRWVVVPEADADAGAFAARIDADAIDVLFDLDGFTGRSAIEIFARRPAPLQINFLGYTGTLGSDAYDRIVTDRRCIPPAAAASYVERPLYVEPCYLPSDTGRPTEGPATRAQCGLPDDAIVALALSNTYKILPDVYARWMRLLARHPRVVLWLRDAGAEVNDRLRAEAQRHGIGPSRLAFAPGAPVSRYLARFALADLFLDTVPFGAHTTVNDALWTGLPVLTVNGTSFAGRASASQVSAAGLASLVAESLDDYEAIADSLFAAPARLGELRGMLRSARRQSPLFDTRRYAEAFSDAVLEAWREAGG